ncbi:Uncharacterized protein (Precursor) [Apilactobacillus kunkeei]|uniref:DUF4352 domain-containing protein n=1 Tax=Apilactobacillus kunkeei TaxID=148814 RepID=UPI0006CE6141|nr:DUF4352 domain-containing protein [Apilactobacillus kunkeei]KPN83319.1 Uncharacterized protein (Precursor) [Apilactobacillus kunkeei]
MKSKMNIWTAAFNIFNCLMLFISWFVVIAQAIANNGNTSGGFFYLVTWVGVILNTISLYYAKHLNISIVGPVLGIIGSALSGLSMIFAFPSIVLLIISVVFEFLQKPAKNASQVSDVVVPWYKVWWIWVVVAVSVILSIAIISVSSSNGSKSSSSNSDVSTTQGKTSSSDASSDSKSTDDSVLNKQYKVGETINYKGYKVTVNDIKYDDGDDINTPKSGNKYVAINVTIQNDTGDKQDYNPYDFKLSADGNGTDLDETTGNDTYDNNTIDSGTLDEGSKVTGYLIGQANPNAKLKLEYQPDFFDNHTVDIDLN